MSAIDPKSTVLGGPKWPKHNLPRPMEPERGHFESAQRFYNGIVGCRRLWAAWWDVGDRSPRLTVTAAGPRRARFRTTCGHFSSENELFRKLVRDGWTFGMQDLKAEI